MQTVEQGELILRDNAARSHIRDHAHLIWNAAERMRGKITPAGYDKVILPFTVLGCMDCGLAPRLDEIREIADSPQNATDDTHGQTMARKPGMKFYDL